MSFLNLNLKSSSSNSLVEKILEQGQRLRNSMVQTVLNNDPFNTEVLNSYNNSPRSDLNDVLTEKCPCDKNKKMNTDKDFERLHKYLRGEEMCLNEEMKALDTLRSMPPNKLIQSTSCKKVCHYKDSCDICREYENKVYLGSGSSTSSEKSLHPEKPICSHKHSTRTYDTDSPAKLSRSQENIPKDLQKQPPSRLKAVKKTFHENQNLLKYIDSLKVNVYSLKLNSAGNRKIMATEINKPYLACANTYFVEYSLPDILTRTIPKTRAKVNTGLNPDKTVRFCSKRLQAESIYFKQQSIHQIQNINLIDLSNVKLEFKVSYRSMKQRNALIIGKAVFNLGYLVANKHFTGEQELVILSENAPVVLGNLKVSVQFGCDKLYFGKEFIDAMNCSKENANLSESDSFHKLSENEPPTTKNIKTVSIPKQSTTKQQHSVILSSPTKEPEPSTSKAIIINPNDEKPLLYVLIFISEVRLLTKPINTYIISRGFSRDDTITSRVVYNEFKPIFNLYQIIPVLLDEEFVNRLRDNFIVIEVWEKTEVVDVLIGIAKLTVHQLYVAYRNPAIVKHLSKNKHPIIGVDWWEPISCPTSHAENGQLRAIVALGTQSQIENLEQTRGLKYFTEKSSSQPKSLVTINDHYKILSSSSLPFESNQNKRNLELVEKIQTVVDNSTKQPSRKLEEIILKDTWPKPDVNKRTVLVSDKYVQEPEIELSPSVVTINKIVETFKGEKVDASTQSEIKEMDSEKDKNTSTNNAPISQKDFLNSFLEQLISAREMNSKNRHVENSTSTDDLIPETALAVMDNKPASPVPSIGSPNDPNMNKTHLLDHTFRINNINNAASNSNVTVGNTSDLLDSLQKALSVNKNKAENIENKKDICDSFKAHIVVENALHLPSRKKFKSKKNKTKSSKNSDEILPSTYVTFKGLNDDNFKITPVFPKSTNPRWDYRCDIRLPTDLLLKNQKRLIFKVWRKANGPSLQPNFQTDIVLGFAALDLTVLLSGLPNVQGWFNIIDFSSKCNGQIKINVTPLENLSKFSEFKRLFIPEKLHDTVSSNTIPPITQKKLESDQETVDETSMPSEFLSRALKRKFTELDEITQRLRQRLSAVTNDDSDLSNDDFIDDFERDLNTVCLETEPFLFSEERGKEEIATSSKHNSASNLLTLNTIFESNLSNKDSERDSSTTSEINAPTVQENLSKLDTHLTEGKLKIDSLLEKLSLLTNENQNKSESFSSRYVSGCSINQETESSKQVLKDIGLEGTNNIDPDLIFNPLLFQQMFTTSLDSSPRLDSLEYISDVHCTTLQHLVQDSTSSGSARDLQSISSNSLSDTNITRQAPDGAGNISND